MGGGARAVLVALSRFDHYVGYLHSSFYGHPALALDIRAPSAASSQTTCYIIAYDIPDDRRRTKVHKVLLGFGKWTQYFEVSLAASEKDNGRDSSSPRADRMLERDIKLLDEQGFDLRKFKGKGKACQATKLLHYIR